MTESGRDAGREVSYWRAGAEEYPHAWVSIAFFESLAPDEAGMPQYAEILEVSLSPSFLFANVDYVLLPSSRAVMKYPGAALVSQIRLAAAGRAALALAAALSG